MHQDPARLLAAMRAVPEAVDPAVLAYWTARAAYTGSGGTMAASDEWTEWHLTPRGWEKGSWRLDNGSTAAVAPPGDAVMTYKYREYLSFGLAPMDVTLSEVWRSNDHGAVDSLLQRWGACPRHL